MTGIISDRDRMEFAERVDDSTAVKSPIPEHGPWSSTNRTAMECISPRITSVTTSPSAIKSTLCLESNRKVKFTFEPHHSAMLKEGSGPHYQVLTRSQRVAATASHR